MHEHDRNQLRIGKRVDERPSLWSGWACPVCTAAAGRLLCALHGRVHNGRADQLRIYEQLAFGPDLSGERRSVCPASDRGVLLL